ncbi:hypothetical protein R6Q59_018624 [Mikania micrantha]
MEASNRHRKLMEYSANGTTGVPLCAIDCDRIANPPGLCSFECNVSCPSFCSTAGLSPAPSPAISPSAVPTPVDHQHHSLSLPLKISIIFVVVTFVYTLYKFFTVWYRSRPHRTPVASFPENQETHDQNDGVDHPVWHIRTTGLQPSVINALTVVKFIKQSKIVEGTDCSVCLTEFEEDDTLRLLPNCKHAFHVSCIDTWLRSHTNCPLCRALIVNNTADSSSSEQRNGDLGFTEEINLGISSMRDDDRGEASGSSGLRIGETDEDGVNNISMKIEDS